MERIISLASGVLPEFPPEQIVASAAAAGFNAVGIWYEADTWSEQLTRNLARALKEQHLIALDIEVVWFHPGEKIDCHDRIVDIAAEIGARNILCVSSEPDIKNTQRRFEHLCRRAEGTDIRIVLEFLSLTTIKTLDQALEVISAVDHPAGGILIDALHLTRNGSTAADLAKIDPRLLPYLQLCDAKLEPDDNSTEGLIDDAIYQRCLPGAGELPLTDLLNAVDNKTPISLEIRSRQLMDKFPDPNPRAKAVYEQAQQYLKGFRHL
jgi:sugar phosphate isomerase/epimerase